MKEIRVKSQKAWDKLPKTFDEYTRIIVESSRLITIARIPGNSSAELRDNSSAVLWGNSRAVLRDNSSAVLWGNSSAKYCDEVLLRFLDIYPIGSRQDHLRTYITDKSTTMRVGCFCGTPDEFAQAVINKHSGNQYFTEYMAALDMIRSIEKQIRGRL